MPVLQPLQPHTSPSWRAGAPMIPSRQAIRNSVCSDLWGQGKTLRWCGICLALWNTLLCRSDLFATAPQPCTKGRSGLSCTSVDYMQSDWLEKQATIYSITAAGPQSHFDGIYCHAAMLLWRLSAVPCSRSMFWFKIRPTQLQQQGW